MNLAAVEKITKAVLYEGCLLYPYRASPVKNRQRWNFGVLSPPAWSENQRGPESSVSQTQVLVQNSVLPAVEIRVRFLHLIARSVGRLLQPVANWPGESSARPEFEPVESLEVNGRIFRPWHEVEEREVSLRIQYGDTVGLRPVERDFSILSARRVEPICDAQGMVVGLVVREREGLSLTVETVMERCAEDVFKVTVRIFNRARFDGAEGKTRDQALMRSLISVHTVVGAENCKFISLLEPPEELRALARCCHNTGVWPVMVGDPRARDTMLSSPIIMCDFPQIAAESAGDMFDATEIDEVLSLRIMTLSDDEKRELCEGDDRARRILERTRNMPADEFMKLRGVIRSRRPPKEEAS